MATTVTMSMTYYGYEYDNFSVHVNEFPFLADYLLMAQITLHMHFVLAVDMRKSYNTVNMKIKVIDDKRLSHILAAL